MGTESLLVLPQDLRDYLEDYGIVTLAQARNFTPGEKCYWFTADDLDMGGEWGILWNKFFIGLEYDRIRLTHQKDSLIWSYDSYASDISAAMGYDRIVHHYLEPSLEHYKVLEFLWAFKIPAKIQCFTWLVVMN